MSGDEPRPLMTLRVYVVRDGKPVEEQRERRITSDNTGDPYSAGRAWPPCECPRCKQRGDE